jgi:ABC-2 type transport system permease protein
MRKILKIAKLELSILFYSPVAWLVLAIFMIQCGITFLENLQNARTTLSLGYQTMPITATLFAGYSGIFTSMQGYIYLYLPILTMGLMSRETSSGSIKLLLSSPVKLRQIILGKYLAIIGYGLTLIFVLMIFGLIGSLFIKDVDMGLIFSGLLALYLLICTYAAIGLFMSCLTTYQVVAAISTLAVFAVMRYVGTIGQEIDFIRDLTYFLSISGRTEKMIAGMITTKDVFYYLIIITSFLSLCVLRLKTERELKPWTIKAGRYVLLAFVALMLGYITSRPMFTGYLDTTARQSLTITKNSQAIAAKIDGPLKVTTYVNMLAPNLWYVLPQSRNSDLGRLEPFKRFIHGMDVSYVYYYNNTVDTNYRDYKYNPNLKGITRIDQVAEKMATTMGVNGDLFMKPSDINKQINLEPEGNLLVRKLEYKGKSTFLRFYMGDNDPYASEAEVTAALKRLLIKVPKVIFITGNKERATDSKADRHAEYPCRCRCSGSRRSDYPVYSGRTAKNSRLCQQGRQYADNQRTRQATGN